jgi:membrane protease YdiL (CAAX protease family)
VSRASSLVTAGSAAVLAVLVGLAAWLSLESAPLGRVGDPEAALALLVGRGLDLDDALRRAPAWERALHEASALEAGSALEQAVAWYEELAAVSPGPAVALRLAVLRAEGGDLAGAREAAAGLRGRAGPGVLETALLDAAYLGEAPGPAAARRLAEAARVALGDDWIAGRLAVVMARRAGDAGLAADGEARALRRQGRLLALARVALAADVGLLLGGALALAGLRRAARRAPGGLRIGAAPVPPAWPPAAAARVLLRGGAAGGLVLLAVGLLPAPTRLLHLALSLAANLAALPLVLLVRRHLLRPAATGALGGFGLYLPRARWGPAARVALALVGLGFAGDWAAGALAERLGAPGHWSEWFDEALAWGGLDEVLLGLLDLVVLAPVLEEVAFRGVLFGSLRLRLGLVPSALASAAVFALAHGYGVGGFLAVLWSGLLWAWAYERTGSLLPGMAAHALNNLSAGLSALLLLRW